MNIKQFADCYKVKIRRDSWDDPIIPGKQFCKDMPERVEYRSHVFDNEDGTNFGVCLMFTSARKWGNARRTLQAANFTIRQNGETEGIGLFNPADKAQAKLALKVAGVKNRRQLSPEQRALLANRLATLRENRSTLHKNGGFKGILATDGTSTVPMGPAV